MATENVIMLKMDVEPPSNGGEKSGGWSRVFSGRGLPEPGSLRVEKGELTLAELADARRDPGVIAAAREMPLKLIKKVKEIEPDTETLSKSETWGIEAVGALSSSYDGADIKVAVLDTGIDPSHSAFSGVNLIQENFTQDPDPDDTNGHGTHVAGTIFGRNVDGLRVGIARGVSDAFIAKVLGRKGGSTGDLINAIQWASKNGAHIISMSLGIDFPGYVEWLVENDMPIAPATSIALEAYRETVALFEALGAYQVAANPFQASSLMIGAGGNESHHPKYEIAVSPPAAGEGVLSVAAIGQDKGKGMPVARFSNTRCDVAAPGVNVISARVGGGVTSMSGTSMAAPHVAGVAALWAQEQLQQDGRVSRAYLKSKLVANASRNGLQKQLTLNEVGQGLVRAPQ